jgi:hypothetical protein
MGEANRRRSHIEAEVEIKGDMAEICAETAAYLLNDSVDRTLLVGPVSWRPSDGTSPRLWYFIVVGCDRTGETFVDQLSAETEADTVEMRVGVMAALVDQRPVVMIDFDDELAMAKWAETVWPSAKGGRNSCYCVPTAKTALNNQLGGTVAGANSALEGFGEFIRKRRDFVERVKALQPQISNRAISEALGVGRRTIDGDVSGQTRPPRSADNEPSVNFGGQNCPPGADASVKGLRPNAWPSDPVDPSPLVTAPVRLRARYFPGSYRPPVTVTAPQTLQRSLRSRASCASVSNSNGR